MVSDVEMFAVGVLAVITTSPSWPLYNKDLEVGMGRAESGPVTPSTVPCPFCHDYYLTRPNVSYHSHLPCRASICLDQGKGALLVLYGLMSRLERRHEVENKGD